MADTKDLPLRSDTCSRPSTCLCVLQHWTQLPYNERGTVLQDLADHSLTWNWIKITRTSVLNYHCDPLGSSWFLWALDKWISIYPTLHAPTCPSVGPSHCPSFHTSVQPSLCPSLLLFFLPSFLLLSPLSPSLLPSFLSVSPPTAHKHLSRGGQQLTLWSQMVRVRSPVWLGLSEPPFPPLHGGDE